MAFITSVFISTYPFYCCFYVLTRITKGDAWYSISSRSPSWRYGKRDESSLISMTIDVVFMCQILNRCGTAVSLGQTSTLWYWPFFSMHVDPPSSVFKVDRILMSFYPFFPKTRFSHCSERDFLFLFNKNAFSQRYKFKLNSDHLMKAIFTFYLPISLIVSVLQAEQCSTRSKASSFWKDSPCYYIWLEVGG